MEGDTSGREEVEAGGAHSLKLMTVINVMIVFCRQ